MDPQSIVAIGSSPRDGGARQGLPPASVPGIVIAQHMPAGLPALPSGLIHFAR
ncbi:MAG: hypothetical protein ACLR9W_00465 [Enterobacter hormaechei]